MDARHFFEVELPSRLVGVTDALPDGVVVSFQLTDAGAWQLRGEAGRTQVEPVAEGPKDCEVRCSGADFSRIVRGPRAATRAFLTGQMAISGDVGLLLRLRPLLAGDPPPVAAR